jgi:energy-coupling factor transport system ATP-binding protein
MLLDARITVGAVAAMTSHLARLDRVSYWYPNASEPALDAVSLDVDAGVTLVTGASGSGKSTLLRVFNGLVPHFHGGRITGTAHVYADDVFSTPTRRLASNVGFLFQDPELQSVYATVERDVAFGVENLGVPRNEMLLRVHDSLARAGIIHLRDRAVATLSGGERQRLALAGVLAMEPRMLVLDEPLSQLDDKGALSLVGLLSSLNERGTGIVMAEHRVEHVLRLATRTVHIEGGRVAGAPRPAQYSPPPPPREQHARDGAHAAEWAMRHVTCGIDTTPIVDIDVCGGGDVVVLCGANGSGKTTVLRTLAGLLRPLSGVVQRSPGRVAYLPQNPTALLHRPTVRAEIAWTVRHAAGDDTMAVEQMLDAFHLRHVASSYPRDLSTGERQRAALAAVLAGGPKLALLDEPTRGMDAFARAALQRAIAVVCAGGGSVVLATHDRELTAAVADRVVELKDGIARPLRSAEAVHA